jgi:molecular chaperone Hsp33
VRLGAAWTLLRNARSYPVAVAGLLGETVTAAVLLAATLKFTGRLTLQLQGNGRVSLLVAQCTHDFQLRGTATHADDVGDSADFRTLVGNGKLVVTIETGQAGGRYQGIVPMQAANVAGCLEDYFMQSEQLPTRLLLHSQDEQCAGLLLQRLPVAAADEAGAATTQAVWEELDVALRQLPATALAEDTEMLLPQVVRAHDCRVYAGTAVDCRCSCSRERVSDALRSIGAREAHSILAEQGSVSMACEFCGRAWRFDALDIERMFATGLPADGSSRLN